MAPTSAEKVEELSGTTPSEESTVDSTDGVSTSSFQKPDYWHSTGTSLPEESTVDSTGGVTKSSSQRPANWHSTLDFQIGSSTEYQTTPLKEISTIAVSPISAKIPAQHDKSSTEFPTATVRKYPATAGSSTISTASTLYSQDASASVGWWVFVAGGAVAVILLVIIILACLRWRRKKRAAEDLGGRVGPEIGRGSQWFDSSTQEPPAALRDSGFREEELEAVPDIELQPRFSVAIESIDKSETIPRGDHSHLDDNVNTYSDRSGSIRKQTDRETVVFDGNSKLFKVKGGTKPDESKPCKEQEHSGKIDKNVGHYQEGGEQYTLVNKPSVRRTDLSNYEFADPFSVSHNNNHPDNHETHAIEEDVYVRMGDVAVEGYINNEHMLRREDNEEDELYANSLQIHRFQSVIGRPHQQELDVPKRSASAVVAGASRPPKPQPRLTKRKTFDPYDYLPGVARKSNEIKTVTEDTKEGNILNNHIYEQAEKESDRDGTMTGLTNHACQSTASSNNEEENIYDVPRHSVPVFDKL